MEEDMIEVIHIETGKKKFFSKYLVEQTSVLKTQGYKVFERPKAPVLKEPVIEEVINEVKKEVKTKK